MEGQEGATDFQNGEKVNPSNHNSTPLPQALRDSTRLLSQQLEPLKKKLSTYFENASWALNESDLADLLKEKGIPTEKIDPSLQLIKWFEENSVSVSYVQKKDSTDYEIIKTPYRFKVYDTDLIRKLYKNVDDPIALLKSLEGIIEVPTFDTFCRTFSQIGPLPHLGTITEALKKVEHIKPQKLSSITFTEFDGTYKPIIEGFNFSTVPEPISYLDSLPDDVRSNLLTESNIMRLNTLIDTIRLTSKSDFKLEIIDIPGLLEIVQDEASFNSFMQSIDWEKYDNTHNIINIQRNFRWIKANLPVLIELDQKGFNMKPYIDRFCNGYRDISSIDFHSENGLPELLERTNMEGFNLQEITTISNDTRFINNARVLHEILGIRIAPRYNNDLKSYFKEEPYFYAAGNTDDIRKVATFYKIAAGTLGMDTHFPIDVLDSIFPQLQPTLSSFTVEEITEMCSFIKAGNFDYFVKGDIRTDMIFLIKGLFRSHNVNDVKSSIELFTSERTKTAIESSDLFLELQSFPYPVQNNNRNKSELLEELVSGETVESKLVLLEHIIHQPEKITFIKELLAKNKNIVLNFQSLEDWSTLFSIPNEQIVQIIDFIQDDANQQTDINASKVSKALLLTALSPEEREEIQSTILNSEQANFKTFLDSYYSSAYVDMLIKNHKNLFSLVESFRKSLHRNITVTGHDYARAETTNDQRLAYMLELANHPELLSIIPQVYPETYKFQLESIPVLLEMNGNDGLLDFTVLLISNGYLFNVDHVLALKNLTFYKSQLVSLLQNESDRNLFFSNINLFASIKPENLAGYVHVIEEISNSTSKDIHKLEGALLRELALSNDPLSDWNEISLVFEKNHLPVAGKVMKVFEILHPPNTISTKIEESAGGMSPTLVRADEDTRYRIIGQDILKVHLLTGNPSLKEYMSTIEQGDSLFSKVESTGLHSLSSDERSQLELFLGKMESLYQNTIRGKGKFIAKGINNVNPDELVLKRMRRIRLRLGITQESQTFHGRISELFLAPLHIHSLSEALSVMQESLTEADRRNRELASSGKIVLSVGDLLKGVNSQYIYNQIQNGIVSNEYFGNESDGTPYDTDTSMILSNDIKGESPDEQFSSALTNSISKNQNYGNIIYVIKDHGQFKKTAYSERQKRVTPDAEPVDFLDTSKYELFNSLVHGDQHWGIRTGIPFTEVSAIIIDTKDESKFHEIEWIKFNIAQYGVYIPIVDEMGTVLFTPENYDQYKIDSSRVNTILKEEKMSPADLLQEYKQNGFLRELLAESAGVLEGWTIEEHTGMVLTQFEKFFADEFSSQLIDRNTFRFILSLHDIGKSLSVRYTGGTAQQHEYTLQIVEPMCNSLGLTNDQKILVTALIDQDYLGDYIKSEGSSEFYAHEIKKKAIEIGVDAHELLQLLKIYYMSDASAYTSTAEYVDSVGTTKHGVSSLENIFDINADESELKFSSQTTELISRLDELI